MKNIFNAEFKTTNSSRSRQLVRYEFKDTVPLDFKDRVCGVETYQKSLAILYLIQIDFLNVKYEKKLFGLRKKNQKISLPKQLQSAASEHYKTWGSSCSY